jgi:class 3 adenylate cyclase
MITHEDSLASFLPHFVLHQLETSEAALDEPVTLARSGAVLFADISQFTARTEELAGRTGEGAEAATGLLNRIFAGLLEVIAGHGGDVASFSGDSITALWFDEPDHDPARSVILASSCGLALQEAVAASNIPDGEAISVSVSIGAGEMFILTVGGFGGQWKYVVGGPAFDQVRDAHQMSKSGAVALSSQARRLAGDAVKARVQPNGATFIETVIAAAEEPTRSGPRLAPGLSPLARSYIPQPVLERMQSGTGWVAELRRITAVFVNLLEIDLTLSADRDRLQAAVASVQEVLDRFEGTLNKVQFDDKGFSLVAAFGLPPFAHEDDAARAAQAALEIQAHLTGLRVESGIGVATGRAFCGVYGSEVHREYTMIGSVVNLASRLMQVGRNEVLSDGVTAEAAKRRLHFAPAGAFKLKGFASEIATYRPLWEKGPTERQLATVRDQLRSTVVGRDKEREALQTRLGALKRKQSSVVVVEGEAGVGKSILVADLVRTAEAQGVLTLVGAGDAVERNAPYHGWRSIIEELLDLWRIVDNQERRQRVLEHLQGWPDLVELAPLLNSVLDLELPETAATHAMTGPMRRDSTAELLVALLQSAASSRPLLVVIDDGHWLDSASWELIRVATRHVHPLMMIVSGRPLIDKPEQLTQLLAAPSTLHLRLDSLELDLAVQLVCNKLGVDRLPEAVADLIKTKGGGHPFFSEELAYALRDSGVIRVSDGQVEILVPASELLHLDLPDTIHGVVTARMDRLAPEEAWTLEIASVLGRNFQVELLGAIHPAGLTVDALRAQLERLEILGLLTQENDDTFSFKHIIIQEAAYQLLSFENRRALHRKAAQQYEERSRDELAATYALLAHHWEGAADPHKTLQYLEAAGGRALDGGADTEAEHYYRRVITLDLEHGELFADVGNRQRAHWHTQLGIASTHVGDLEGAARSYYSALAILGLRVPVRVGGRLLRLGWEMLVQIGRLVIGTKVRTNAGERSEELAQAARICSLIGEVYYFTADLLGFPMVNLMSINLAEKSGRAGSAGLAYSSFSYLVGTLRLHRLASHYNRRAQSAELEAAYASTEPADPWIVPLGPAHKVAAAYSWASYLLGANLWDEVLPTLDQGIESCRALRDRYTLALGLTIRSIAYSCVSPSGDLLRDVTELMASARERSNPQHEAWSIALGVPALLTQNRVDEAVAWCEHGKDLMPDADPLTRPIFEGVLSLALLRAEKRDEALASAKKALTSLGRAPVFPNLVGYRAMLETLLTMWSGAARSDPARVREMEINTRRALQKLRFFALVFPFARPTLALYRGWSQWLRGRRGAARRTWQRGLRQAAEVGLTWDEARLHYRLAREALADGSERRHHLNAARDLFKGLGAEHELGLLALLEGSESTG